MKITVKELRGLIQEVLGSLSPDQKLAKVELRVKRIIPFLHRDKIEAIPREEWEGLKDSLTRSAEYFSAAPSVGMEDPGDMLSVFVSVVDNLLQMTKFWSRPSFLGRDKWERDFDSKIDAARAVGQEFLDAIQKYRKFRDLKVPSTPVSPPLPKKRVKR